jgi:hypothetical protein
MDTLSNVVVTGRKLLVEKLADRSVVHIDKMLSSAGSDVYRLLENIPGITVTEEGGITLNGKSGILVLINDKPTYLSGTALVNYLRSLPSSVLEKIELMPNPPARYDAAGAGGVINIRMKKNSLRGFHGNANLAATQGYLFSSNNSLALSYRQRKWNFFSTLSMTTNNRFTDLEIRRRYLNEQGQKAYTFSQNTYIRMRDKSPGIRLGIEYALDNKTSFGITGNVVSRPFRQNAQNKSLITQPDQSVDSSTIANNIEKEKWKNYSLNLSMNRQLSTDRNLSADFDYISYHSSVEQDFQNLTQRPDESLHYDALRGSLPGEIDITAGKLDYLQTYRKWKAEAGVKSSYAFTRNRYEYTYIDAAGERPDYDKSNHFRYRENIHAAYLSVQTDPGPLSVKAGLRSEWTVSRGHQLGNPMKSDSTFRRAYLNLFPTIFISYKLDTMGNHQLSFSYGKRIERPFYQDLNPYVTPLDKFTLYVGNPFLLPSISSDYSLAYTFKKKLTTTITYNDLRNAFMEAITVNGNNYMSRPDNIGRNQLLILSFNLGQPVTKWWSTNSYVETGNRRYRGSLYNKQMDTSAFYLTVNISNQLQLGKGWAAELGGFYRSGLLVGQVSLAEIWMINAGIQKKVLKNKGTIRLAVRDLFYSGIRHGEIHFLDRALADFRNRPDSRTLSLSLSLQFGSGKQHQTRSSGSAEEEINRVRS